MRHLTDGVEEVLGPGRVVICDRDPKWSRAVVGFLEREGLLLGERHLRRTMSAFVAHYHEERNHQGIGNELIQPLKRADGQGRVRRRQRMGGMLNFYYRAAA